MIYISFSISCCILKIYDEMFCFFAIDACFVVFFNICSHAQIFSKCLQRFVFRNLRSCLHAKIVLDILMNHFARLLYLINICSEMFFITMLDQMRFTSKIWSEIVMFHRKHFFLFYEKYKQFACYNISFFLCQYECDLSKIVNFCLIWITHETWNNEQIKSLHINLKIVVNVYFISNFWICFCSIIHWSNSRIRALSILLSFSNERIIRQNYQRFYRRMQHVFEYVFA